MKLFTASLLVTTLLMADNFTLSSSDLKGQLTKTQEFNGFGCTGDNISPQLSWSHAPKGTKSFALTVYDPDAPTGSGWWHWLVVNMPADASSLPTGVKPKDLPKGALETMNDYGVTSFGGACPPEGDTHHQYIFTLHALDVEKLDVTPKSDSALVGFMINAHTIEKTSLVSYYKR
jgi:Raf kinase inhibitor-like YbhB/YbcL family protein